jgi:hypothetical protein
VNARPQQPAPVEVQLSTDAYVAHVRVRSGATVRKEIPSATSRAQAAAMAMKAVGPHACSALARPVDYRARTIDCRVSLTTPVKHSDSEFGELLS